MILKHLQNTHSIHVNQSFFAAIKPSQSPPVDAQTAEQMRTLSLQRRKTKFAYQALQNQLLTTTDKGQMQKIITELAAIATLQHLCFTGTDDVEVLNQEIAAYTQWLQQPQTSPNPVATFSPEGLGRSWHRNLNFPRLLTFRLRRGLLATRPLLTDSPILPWLQNLDVYTSTLANYQSWIFFVPRLLVNLIFFTRHLIENDWMSPLETELGLMTRFQIEMDARYFELANDLNWLICGLLGCFTLVGTLACWAPYLIAFAQLLDVVIGLFRLIYEGKQYTDLINEYTAIKQNDPTTTAEVDAFLVELSRRLASELNNDWLNLINAIILTVAFGMFCFTATPWFPLGAAVLTIAMTLINCILGQLCCAQTPDVVTFLQNNPPPPI